MQQQESIRRGGRGAILALVVVALSGGISCETSSTHMDEKAASLSASETSEASTSRLFIHSLSNNPLTPFLVDGAKAKQLAASLAQRPKALSRSENIKQLEKLMVVERLGGAPLDRLLLLLKRLVTITKEGAPEAKISELARLEVALAALQEGQLAMATFFLDELASSSEPTIQAGVYNARGLLAIRDQRLPEAIAYWQQALKAMPGYKSALFNLGMTSLEFGQFEQAKGYLSPLAEDWFAQSGLLVASRLVGESAATSRLCEQLLLTHPLHKPTLFNCGVHEWQSNNNLARARQLIQQALSLEGGPASWEAQGKKILAAIR